MATKKDETPKGVDKLQDQFDEADSAGYFGVSSDSTPAENYTLAGVVAGLPTPETERGK